MALRFLIVFTFVFALMTVCLDCKSRRKKRSVDEHELDLLLERNGYAGSKKVKRMVKESCFTEDCAKAKARAKRQAVYDDMPAPKKHKNDGKQKPLKISEEPVHPIIPKLKELTQKVADLQRLKNERSVKPVQREIPVAHGESTYRLTFHPCNCKTNRERCRQIHS